MAKAVSLTRARLSEVLSFDAESGAFTWRVSRGRSAKRGQIAGYARADGYSTIKVDGRRYYAHRLAWFWVHGEWPSEIDHVSGNPAQNGKGLLRPATHSQNLANAKRRSDNSSGFKGVSLNKRTKRWRAQITKDGVGRHLGEFDTPQEAHRAYVAAARRIHGRFARAA